MANPAEVTLTTAGTWYKVASAVLTGRVFIKIISMNYFYTYRLAGGAAPSGTAADELPVENYKPITIESAAPIDVYLKASKDAGKVIVHV